MQQPTESIGETEEQIWNGYGGERAPVGQQCAPNEMPNHCINTDKVEKEELGLRPFKDIQETLRRLEQDDPKLAFQSARLVGLYRRLWESCAIKHVDARRLKKETEGLRVTTSQLSCESGDLSRLHEDQVARLDCLEQSLEQVRLNLLGILDEWKEPTSNA